jgi:hypothetical protein
MISVRGEATNWINKKNSRRADEDIGSPTLEEEKKEFNDNVSHDKHWTPSSYYNIVISFSLNHRHIINIFDIGSRFRLTGKEVNDVSSSEDEQ